MLRKNWAERAIQITALIVIAIPYGVYLVWRELRRPEPL